MPRSAPDMSALQPLNDCVRNRTLTILLLGSTYPPRFCLLPMPSG
jgi:hypothetical protein